jgi:hypothetical protein
MQQPLALKCPSCASAIRDSDYDHGRGMIRCGYCKALMLPPPQNRTSSMGYRHRPEIPLPARMNLETTVGGLKITRRWCSWVVLFLILFCIVWNSSLAFWFGMLPKMNVPVVFTLLPMLHVAAGIGITYFTLASIINKTVIAIDRGTLGISHGPLPWPGRRRIDTNLIDQLYCKEIVRHGEDGPIVSHELWVALKNGHSSKLIGAGLNVDQALYIEQQIERFLGMEDKPMSGEVQRI